MEYCRGFGQFMDMLEVFGPLIVMIRGGVGILANAHTIMDGHDDLVFHGLPVYMTDNTKGPDFIAIQGIQELLAMRMLEVHLGKDAGEELLVFAIVEVIPVCVGKPELC